MSRTDSEHSENAKAHLTALRGHLKRGDMSDEVIFDAVCMRLGAAIESVSAIDKATLDREFGVTWAQIWSVRNRLAHGYIYADKAIIEATVTNDLDAFEASIDRLAIAVVDNQHPA